MSIEIVQNQSRCAAPQLNRRAYAPCAPYALAILKHRFRRASQTPNMAISASRILRMNEGPEGLRSRGLDLWPDGPTASVTSLIADSHPCSEWFRQENIPKLIIHIQRVNLPAMLMMSSSGLPSLFMSSIEARPPRLAIPPELVAWEDCTPPNTEPNIEPSITPKPPSLLS